MRQKINFDQVTRKSTKITLINIQETLADGSKKVYEMQLRHALMAMRVQPDKFKLAPGEKLPKGISIDMVPIGTTVKDVEEFEKIRGTVGKVQKTTFDNVLEAIEQGIEIADVETEDQDPGATPGAMMSEDAPEGFVPQGVDLTPADSMKEPEEPGGTEENEAALTKAEVTTPELKEIKEKELKFDDNVKVKANYTKKQLEPLPVDQLQAILLNLPSVKDKPEKYQKNLLKGAKKGNLIESIVQLSKLKPKAK